MQVHTCSSAELSPAVRSRRSVWQCRQWPPRWWHQTSTPPCSKSLLCPGHSDPGRGVGRGRGEEGEKRGREQRVGGGSGRERMRMRKEEIGRRERGRK